MFLIAFLLFALVFFLIVWGVAAANQEIALATSVSIDEQVAGLLKAIAQVIPSWPPLADVPALSRRLTETAMRLTAQTGSTLSDQAVMEDLGMTMLVLRTFSSPILVLAPLGNKSDPRRYLIAGVGCMSHGALTTFTNRVRRASDPRIIRSRFRIVQIVVFFADPSASSRSLA